VVLSEQHLTHPRTQQFYMVWRANVKHRAVVVLQHGIPNHAAALKIVAEYLCPRGFVVFSGDLRGYGKKWKPRVDGYIPQFEIVCNDLYELVDAAKAAHPDIPVFLAGHSMGGLAACHYGILYATKMNVNGLISVAPAYKLTPKTDFLQSIAQVFAPVVGKILPTFQVTFELDQNVLKHDEALKEVSRKDPLVCKKIAVGTPIHAEACQKFDNENAANFNASLLMLVAMADSTVDPNASIAVFEKFGSKDKECVKLDGYFHEVWAESKDMREKVYEMMITWMEKRMPDQKK